MLHRNHWWLLSSAAIAAAAAPAHAALYLSLEQAQQAIFPDQELTPAAAVLSAEQSRAIEKKSGVHVRLKDLRLWREPGGGWFIVDEVVGKHEFITYAVGLTASGEVQRIEIMEYRESYGDQVRNEAWRQQFVGKTAADPLKLTGDIQNISGATLSCRHITDGVKRLLATYDVVLRAQ